MSEVKVNKISPRTACGTVTLGDSGDTFTVPSGVTITNNGTQTGFGREGSVDWQTGSIKTAGFTATTGEGYFCNTSGGAFTVALPAGVAGSIVSIADYTRTFDTDILTVSPDGSEKIGGIADDVRLNVAGQSATFVYVDSTEGWINVQETETSKTGAPPFVAATGGTITTCGDYKIHSFTGPGTFTVSCAGSACGSNTIDYMVVAGGGGGGNGNPSDYAGGGGGAGGYRESPGAASGCYTASPLGVSPAAALPVAVAGYPVAVGGGGAGSSTPGGAAGTSGVDSVFTGTSTITSAGGGGGATAGDPAALDGGSGGGGVASCGEGSGNTPPVTPPQGTDGGDGVGNAGGGGGGALLAGDDHGAGGLGGNGGGGATSSISGSSAARAGGGGGSGYTAPVACGGAGGGGNGADSGATAATVGIITTGGGGGGGASIPTHAPSGTGAQGGSGIVIIRYKYQ